MDPNTLTNTGTDLGVWISAIVAWALGLAALAVSVHLFKKWKTFVEEDHEDIDRAFVRALIGTVITILLVVTGFWLVFGAYGPGEPVNLPSPSSDGFQKIVQEAPEEISDEAKEKLGKEKLPEILKEVQRKAAQDGGTEDDYIKKAIERANKMRGGEK